MRWLCVWLAIAGCDDFRSGPSDAQVEAPVSPFTVVQTGLTETLRAVWGADATHVFAVGTNDTRYGYDGTQWSAWTRNVVGRDFHGVWGSSASDVYAVGEIAGQGIVSHYDGMNWRDEYVAATPLYSVWGDSYVVFAVGPKGMVYGKATGTTSWALRTAPLPPNPAVTNGPDAPVLWQIAGSSDLDFALAGGLARVFHFEPPNFVTLDPTVDDTWDFRSVFAVPGSQPTTYFFGTNYLGLTWLANSGPPDADLVNGAMFEVFQDRASANAQSLFIHGIWGDQTRVVFVGDAAHIGVYDTVANMPTTVPSPLLGISYGGVWGTSMSDLWIVGDGETILHGSL